MTRLVTSYSHEDEDLRDKLDKHMSMLKRSGRIESWHDRRILVGDRVDATIDTHFARAHIILLLVSPDFLNSSYCMDIEVWRALHRHERGEARVVPVILRPCDWHDAPFGHLQAAPRDGRPITLWSNQDQAFVDVVRAIKGLLVPRQHRPWQPESLRNSHPLSEPPAATPSQPSTLPGAVSSPSPSDPKHELENVEQAAAHWVIRLESPTCTQVDWNAFTAWRLESPRNRAAYTRISEAWRVADALKRLRPLDGVVDPDLLKGFGQDLSSATASGDQPSAASGKSRASHSF